MSHVSTKYFYRFAFILYGTSNLHIPRIWWRWRRKNLASLWRKKLWSQVMTMKPRKSKRGRAPKAGAGKCGTSDFWCSHCRSSGFCIWYPYPLLPGLFSLSLIFSSLPHGKYALAACVIELIAWIFSILSVNDCHFLSSHYMYCHPPPEKAATFGTCGDCHCINLNETCPSDPAEIPLMDMSDEWLRQLKRCVSIW